MRDKNIKKWKSVKVQQELAEEAEKEAMKNEYKSLSEFVSEAIRLRLEALARGRVSEYLESYAQTKPIPQAQVFYTSNHMWAKATPQGRIRVGVSEYFCLKVIGITHIELSVNVGGNLVKGEPFAIAETPAWPLLYDLRSPVDGELVKVNGDVLDDPLILREDPSNWIVEIKSAASEIEKESPEFLRPEEYEELVAVFEDRAHLPTESELNEIIAKIKR